MKLLPLLGALLLSASPVQASMTPRKILEPCKASENTIEACKATGMMYGAVFHFTKLCDLWEAGVITPKVWADDIKPDFDEEYESVMWDQGIKAVLEEHPNCPIKPIP